MFRILGDCPDCSALDTRVYAIKKPIRYRIFFSPAISASENDKSSGNADVTPFPTFAPKPKDYELTEEFKNFLSDASSGYVEEDDDKKVIKNAEKPIL